MQAFKGCCLFDAYTAYVLKRECCVLIVFFPKGMVVALLYAFTQHAISLLACNLVCKTLVAGENHLK